MSRHPHFADLTSSVVIFILHRVFVGLDYKNKEVSFFGGEWGVVRKSKLWVVCGCEDDRIL